MILEVARGIHWAACEAYRGPLDPRLAHPFGRPPDMPPHRWRVSWDILQALYDASPPPAGDNPKTADGDTRLLFGWRVDLDPSAPVGTMLLEQHG